MNCSMCYTLDIRDIINTKINYILQRVDHASLQQDAAFPSKIKLFSVMAYH